MAEKIEVVKLEIPFGNIIMLECPYTGQYMGYGTQISSRFYSNFSLFFIQILK